jgi:hypothetical protein
MKALTKKQAEQLVSVIESNVDGIVAGSSTLIDDLRRAVEDKKATTLLEEALVARVVANGEFTSRKMPKIDGKDQKDVFKMKTTCSEIDVYRASLAKVETDEDKPNWTFKFGWDGLTGIVNTCHIQRVTSTGGNGKTPAKTSNDSTTCEELIGKAIRLYGLDQAELVFAQLKAATLANKGKRSKMN